MKLRSILTIILFVLFTSLQAAIFQEYGKVASAKFKPANSPVDLKYDVFYYIPKKLQNQTNLNTLVFLHGGGASTSDRAGSARVAKMYIEDLKTFAENLNLVLIAPSGSGLNWGGHMINYLKELNKEIIKDLKVNPNKIALSGHSMGGMGITRTAHWLTDRYNFFMPTAAGMDERHQIERNLRPYFNMTYHHLQGLNDHFQVFVTRSRLQKENIETLEAKYGEKTGFNLEFYNGSHNYPKTTYENRLKELFKTQTRNMYQKSLHGMFYYRNDVTTDNLGSHYHAPRMSYFWLKALKLENEKTVYQIDAKIQNNLIDIQTEEGIKTLRVFLSDKLVNTKEIVTIKVNNKTVFSDLPILLRPVSKEYEEIYSTYIDLEL